MNAKTLSLVRSLSTWAACSSVVAVSAACAGAPDAPPVATVESGLTGATELLVNDGPAPQTEPSRHHLALVLDGKPAGLLNKVSGGHVKSQVTAVPESADFLVEKQVGHVKYEDFDVALGASLSDGVAAWISESLAAPARRSGAIIDCSADFSTCDTREFREALLTEVGLHAGDGGAKAPASLNLKFSPWIVQNNKGSSSVDDPIFAQSDQNTWQPSNIHFSVEGLAISISKLEGLILQRSAVTGHIGQPDLPKGAENAAELPDLKISVSEARAQLFVDWNKEFVIDGGSSEGKRKTASLTFKTATKSELTLDFNGIGIFKITRGGVTNNDDKISTVTVEMYAENITSKFGR